MTMTKHHIFYPTLGVLLLAFIVFLFYEHEKRKNLEKDVAVEETKQKAAEAQKAAIEAIRSQQVADLEAQRSKPATVQTVTKYLPAPLPTGSAITIQKDPVTGKDQVVVTGDAQQNLQAFQNMAIDCSINKVNLNACQKTLDKDEKDIIPSLTKERDDLKKLAIPHWTLTTVISKSRIGDYKPGALLEYRISKHVGVTAGAVNNSLVVGASIHFGGGVK